MFFQDSIRNYRPLINGLFWEYRKQESYANIWLDWTGRQTDQQHESFFMGWSGRYHSGIFYAQHFGYMFHFAALKAPIVHEPVHDNGLLLTSAGLDLAAKTGWDQLEINAGWSIGLDRDRWINEWNTPQGLLSEIKIEYRGLGLSNTYYKGSRQQVYYNDYGNQLYWADPVYRTNAYDRLDGIIHFLKTDAVQLRLVYSLHFMENRMYHEQAFYATFDLDNLKNRKTGKKYRYVWDNWF